MRRLLTVRNTLCAIGGVGGVLLLALTAELWTEAWSQEQSAKRLLESAIIEDALLESARGWSVERDLAHVGLNRGAALGSTDGRALVEARGRADQAFADALARLGQSTGAADRGPARQAGEASFERVRDLRAQIDAALKLPRAARDKLLVVDWFPAMTDLIMAAAALRQAARFEAAPTVSEIRALRDLKDAVWVMAEFAERESTLIAGTIAAEHALVLAKARALATFRGHLEEAWRNVSTQGQDATTDPAVAAAILSLRDGYFASFEEIRAPVILAGMLGDDYPLSAPTWRQRAATAIAPIHALGQAAGRLSKRLTEAQLAAGIRGLAVATAILFATVAMGAVSLWIVVAWVVRPLGRITGAMTALAGGDQTIQVPATEAYGEIGAMARAVAVFKATAEAHAAEILRANETLEARVRERTRDLASARDQAVEASAAKSRFLANMSHELRTPLTIIMGQAELMAATAAADGEAAPSGEEIDDIETILASSRHLLRLIDEVLDLAKIEAGKMTLARESFAVGAMVEALAATIRPMAAENGNRLELDLGPGLATMESDPTKLRQVLFNLLSNACKFTHDGTVGLEVRRQAGPEGGADEIVFTVRDTGIGMSEATMATIFDAFTQADSSTTREYSGTGLGLAITRQVCHLLGGEVEVESRPGEGATFTMRLAAGLPTALRAVSGGEAARAETAS